MEWGFVAAGIADAAPTKWSAELVTWLEAGRHGSMSYLQDQLNARLDPSLVLPAARSAIMVADLYAKRGSSEKTRSPGASPQGRIARYAQGRDYHIVMKQRLHALADALRVRFPEEQFRACVDTAPVMEREYAARAGLGWIGKHTLLIHPRLGSFTLLGGILTTLDLQPPPEQQVIPDHCGACTRCIDACPTSAITPYSVDASRCISYLTIEHRGEVDPEFHEPIGDWLFGCDICQEVCPHNSPRGPGIDVGTPRPEYAPRHQALPILSVLGWTPADRAEATRHSAMKRATLAMMRRNAVIVAGNALARQHDPVLHRRLTDIAADSSEDEIVRRAAAAALARLAGKASP